MKYLNEIKKFIGHAKYDEWGGSYIWGCDNPNNENSPLEMIAQVNMPPKAKTNEVLSIRGWGAIQNMFPSITDAEQFQDELGRFIADAINEKLQRDENT
jgi:hypothetical protein